MVNPSSLYSDSTQMDSPTYDIATARRSSFRKSFEQHLNDEMSGPSKCDSMHKAALCSPTLSDIDDGRFNEKKHEKCETPPRFSTLFPPSAPIPLPAPALSAREFESHPKRKSGIYLPTPVFWALLAFLLLESAMLFAYTTLGLLSRFQLTTIATPYPQQPIINISPNFLLPGGTLPTALTTIATSTSTAEPSTSTAAQAASSAAAAAAVLSALTNLAHTSTSSTSSKRVTTITVDPTPTPNIVSSTTILTVDPSGNTLPPAPTVTSTKVIAASDVAAAASSSSTVKGDATPTGKVESGATSTAAASETKATDTSAAEITASITAAPDLLTPDTTSMISTEATSTNTAKCIGAMGRMGNQNLCP
ncbi:hypothetical protein B0A48_07100 [Cryoendolithus antarcticus]|uniref:Uncharacterized protein n=1 Tax=Cryoendolithus antarcticus TaxID=1507870 RepID=A0A1V8T7M1_9PEZI|nr:hypothetical protein B0A48_07100 [Cryoendolithus antarcticus]